MKVVTTYHDKPVFTYGISFARWSTRTGGYLICERIYRKGGKWTPFLRCFLRHDKLSEYFKHEQE